MSPAIFARWAWLPLWALTWWRWLVAIALVGAGSQASGSGFVGWLPIALTGTCVSLGLAWSAASPASFERYIGGPGRRRVWRRRALRRWPQIADSCGLGIRVPVRRWSFDGSQPVESRVVVPRLRRVRA